jgi:hypothetical protein
MKKIILIIATTLLINQSALAQNDAITNDNPSNSIATSKDDLRQDTKNNRDKKFKNLPVEKKESIKNEREKHRENIRKIPGAENLENENNQNLDAETRKKNRKEAYKNLSPESREQIKQENARYRNEIENISGIDDEYSKDATRKPKRNCQEPSAEERENHRKIMQNLSQEKRDLVKKEKERHFQEMKNITGVDLPRPRCVD